MQCSDGKCRCKGEKLIADKLFRFTVVFLLARVPITVTCGTALALMAWLFHVWNPFAPFVEAWLVAFFATGGWLGWSPLSNGIFDRFVAPRAYKSAQ